MGTDRGNQPPDVTFDVRRSGQDRGLTLFATPTKGPRAGTTIPLGPLSAKADLARLAEDVKVELRTPPLGAEAREDAVRDVGSSLWGQMTDEFKEFYSDYLFRHEISSIAICGANAYLPWELIWPQDSGVSEQVKAQMFGASFAVARWPAPPLPSSFQMTSFDIISAPVVPIPVHATPLPGGFLSEVNNLKATMPNLGVEGASAADLKQLFTEPKPRILHVTAHGDLDRIILQDRPITRVTFDADKFDRLTEPTLVFLSSCRTAGSVWTPDEFDVESWATAFIALNCAACVAPLWNVVGLIGRQVSETFYQNLMQDMTLAEAMQERRLWGATTANEDERFAPTWFAYVVFGNPNAQISFA